MNTTGRPRLRGGIGLVPGLLLSELLACDGGRAADPGYTLEVERHPLRYRLLVHGEEVVSQTAGGGSGGSAATWSFHTDRGEQHPVELLSMEHGDGGLEARFATSDGRQASLRVSPAGAGGPHRGARVELTFVPEEGVLGVADHFTLAPGEAIRLSERVASNADRVARDPAVEASLDRRGHLVELRYRGTISLYAPFLVSRRGYGRFVEGTWGGEVPGTSSSTARSIWWLRCSSPAPGPERSTCRPAIGWMPGIGSVGYRARPRWWCRRLSTERRSLSVRTPGLRCPIWRRFTGSRRNG